MRHLFAMLAAATTASNAAAQPENPLADRPNADEVFYHFMPIAWRDGPDTDTADPNRFGDFQGMRDGLGYLEGMGFTSVWMNPVFPSPAYHGYQHGRADQINPSFGTEQQFLDFVADANARDIDIYLDFVVYGISGASPWFQSAFNNPSSPFDSWLAFKNANNTSYTGYSFNTWNGDSVVFSHWDLRNSDAKNLVLDWTRKWLDPNQDGDFADGIKGYRLDHVWVEYNRGEHPEGWGYDLDTFWADWHDAVRTTRPDAFTFAEQHDWGSHGAEFLTQFDAAMTKPFEFSARDALRDGNASSLYSQMAATVGQLPAQGTFVGIIGDHDVDRLASVINADTPATLAKGRAAAAVLMLQPFPPIVYFGDEIGMTGTKQDYGSDANDIPFREPFKWDATNGSAPMTRYHQLSSTAFNNSFSSSNDGRSVEEQQGVPGSLLETYRELIATRHANVALRRGSYTGVPSTDSAIWAFHRRYDQGQAPIADTTQSLVCLVNLADSTRSPQLDLSGFDLAGQSVSVTDAQTGAPLADLTAANQDDYQVAVLPYGYRLLSIDITPTQNRFDGDNIPNDMGADSLKATQDTPTAMGDNQLELNQLFARHEGDRLNVGLTGNIDTSSAGLVLLLDADPNSGTRFLDFDNAPTPPFAPSGLTGTFLDDGFEPERMLFVNAAGANLYVDAYQLSLFGVGKTYLGRGGVNSGTGVLAEGSNPDGVLVAFSNRNTVGVTSSSAQNADTATSGFEISLPHSFLGFSGDACESVRVAAFLITSNGMAGNQSLPGIAGAWQFEFPAIFTDAPGDQFVPVAVPSPADTNADGLVTPADFNAWIIAFNTQSPACDQNADGMCTPADFNAWIINYNAGCP